MRLGGPARYVIRIEQSDDISEAYEFAAKHNLPTVVLGRGSNFLGLDRGYMGVVLLNEIRGIDILSDDAANTTIRANGGEILDDLVAYSVKQNLSGIELLSGIPGTVGAAPVQNSGAYGAEIGDCLLSVDVYDIEAHKVRTLNKSALKLSYRHSIFNSTAAGKYFIISIKLRLNKAHLTPPFYKSLQAYLDERKITAFTPANIRATVLAIRTSKLPDPTTIASAGSFFKNVVLSEAKAKKFRQQHPEAPIFEQNGQFKLATAWLLDQAGLKGYASHGIVVHPDAPLVLINQSAQSYSDLAAARDEIIAAIKEKFGLTLAAEPQEIK